MERTSDERRDGQLVADEIVDHVKIIAQIFRAVKNSILP